MRQTIECEAEAEYKKREAKAEYRKVRERQKSGESNLSRLFKEI